MIAKQSRCRIIAPIGKHREGERDQLKTQEIDGEASNALARFDADTERPIMDEKVLRRREEPPKGHDDGAAPHRLLVLSERDPRIVRAWAIPPDQDIARAHQIPLPSASKVARPRWMPHSVFSCPRQRPARSSSPSRLRSLHGMQPTEA